MNSSLLLERETLELCLEGFVIIENKINITLTLWQLFSHFHLSSSPAACPACVCNGKGGRRWPSFLPKPFEEENKTFRIPCNIFSGKVSRHDGLYFLLFSQLPPYATQPRSRRRGARRNDEEAFLDVQAIHQTSRLSPASSLSPLPLSLPLAATLRSFSER